ncbi:MAG: hypothetical protein ACOY3D_03860 [Candidatus Omnitrophota bacterium]
MVKKPENLNAQTTLEYAVMIILVAITLIATQVYIKRAIQGRWKQSADTIGEQYDYDRTRGTTTITYESDTLSNTTLEVDPTTGEGWLQRKDDTTYNETRTVDEEIPGSS